MSNVKSHQFQMQSKILTLPRIKGRLWVTRRKRSYIDKTMLYTLVATVFLLSLITFSFLNGKLFLDKILVASSVIGCLLLLKNINRGNPGDKFIK